MEFLERCPVSGPCSRQSRQGLITSPEQTRHERNPTRRATCFSLDLTPSGCRLSPFLSPVDCDPLVDIDAAFPERRSALRSFRLFFFRPSLLLAWVVVVVVNLPHLLPFYSLRSFSFRGVAAVIAVQLSSAPGPPSLPSPPPFAPPACRSRRPAVASVAARCA